MATCNPLSSNDLRVANFRLPSVYFRRSAAPVFHRKRISSWMGRAARSPASLGENAMCEIGKPIEIIDVEPLSLPAPLRKEKEQPTEQPVTVEVPVTETTVEPSLVEKL